MLGVIGRITKKKTVSDLRDFNVTPTSANIKEGGTESFKVDVSGGLSIESIRVESKDEAKAKANLSKNKITVIGVSKGKVKILVKSTEIMKVIELSVTIEEVKATEVEEVNKKLEN